MQIIADAHIQNVSETLSQLCEHGWCTVLTERGRYHSRHPRGVQSPSRRLHGKVEKIMVSALVKGTGVEIPRTNVLVRNGPSEICLDVFPTLFTDRSDLFT